MVFELHDGIFVVAVSVVLGEDFEGRFVAAFGDEPAGGFGEEEYSLGWLRLRRRRGFGLGLSEVWGNLRVLEGLRGGLERLMEFAMPKLSGVGNLLFDIRFC